MENYEFKLILWAILSLNILPCYANEESSLTQIDYNLLFSIKENLTSVCKKLIEKGANVNAQTATRKYTPLHFAIFFNRPQICKLLILAGANLNIFDDNCHTPLTYAIVHNRINLIRIFLITPSQIEYKKIKAAKCGLIALRYSQPKLLLDIRKLIDQKLIDSFAQDHINRVKKMIGVDNIPLLLSIRMEHIEIAQFLDPANFEEFIFNESKKEIRDLLIPSPN